MIILKSMEVRDKGFYQWVGPMSST